MSNLITGKHLEPQDLDGQDVAGKLERFRQWAGTVEFRPVSPSIEKCEDKDRDQYVRRLLTELGYEIKVGDNYIYVKSAC